MDWFITTRCARTATPAALIAALAFPFAPPVGTPAVGPGMEKGYLQSTPVLIPSEDAFPWSASALPCFSAAWFFFQTLLRLDPNTLDFFFF